MAPGIPAALERPHFIGIGGAGMSGIAKILAQRGAKVAGSDARESATADALRALGATVHIGHAAGHLADDATSVVVSSAIRADNPELVRAAELDIPVVHRSDALASLMDGLRSIAVAGTHGKTTTTSMLAVALSELALDPSYAIGGDLEGPGTNATHGDGDIFVAEADESDRSFQKYAPEVAIVLNVELDHHANYASMDEIYESFETFVGKVVPGGTLVVAADQPGAVELTRRVRERSSVRVVTYGESEGADVRVHKVTPRGLTSEVTVVLNGKFLTFTVSVPGRHYAHNAVAALAAGVALGVPAHNLASAIGTYTGVKRRLQLKGEAAGCPGDRLVRAPPHGDGRRPGGHARRGERVPPAGGLPAPPLLPHPGARHGDGPGPRPRRRVAGPGHLPGQGGPAPGRHERPDHRRREGRGSRRHGRPRQGRRPRGRRGNGEAR